METPKTTIKLPSGATAEIRKFKGKDVRRATAMTNGDTSLYIFALIALCTTIDGKGIVMEEVDEMDGADVLSLMGQFGENFQPAQAN